MITTTKIIKISITNKMFLTPFVITPPDPSHTLLPSQATTNLLSINVDGLVFLEYEINVITKYVVCLWFLPQHNYFETHPCWCMNQ